MFENDPVFIGKNDFLSIVIAIIVGYKQVPEAHLVIVLLERSYPWIGNLIQVKSIVLFLFGLDKSAYSDFKKFTAYVRLCIPNLSKFFNWSTDTIVLKWIIRIKPLVNITMSSYLKISYQSSPIETGPSIIALTQIRKT